MFSRRVSFAWMIALLVVVAVLLPTRPAGADGDIEQRIADFWKRVDALQPGDYLASADLGQWALNVTERNPRARTTVADFRLSTAEMQGAMDRAGLAPAPPTPAPVPAANVEQRIADFWGRVNSLQPTDYLSAADIGQWALNVIGRNPLARIAVADFRASANGMQARMDRAGLSPTGPTASPAPTTTTTPPPSISLPPTPTPTPTPNPTPNPTPTQGLGPVAIGSGYQVARYTDGWKVSLLQFQEQGPSTYSRPDAGMRFVSVFVRYENGSLTTNTFNPYDFELQDTQGVRQSRAFYSGRNDSLNSGELVSGAFVTGSLVFQAPVGDFGLQLIYSGSYSHDQFTWQLYANPPARPQLVSSFVSASYTDGWKVTPLTYQEQLPSTYSVPDSGMRFVAVIVRFDNNSALVGYFNPYHFQVQDSGGVRRSQSFYSNRTDALHSGDLAPGAFVTGSLVFQAPIGDVGLRLIYSGYVRTQFTWLLR